MLAMLLLLHHSFITVSEEKGIGPENKCTVILQGGQGHLAIPFAQSQHLRNPGH
jgi:hypothetical protein